MFYKEIKNVFTPTVIAGGLAHIPVVIGVFSFIQKFFSKRASNFPQDIDTKKSPVKPVEQKSASEPVCCKSS